MQWARSVNFVSKSRLAWWNAMQDCDHATCIADVPEPQESCHKLDAAKLCKTAKMQIYKRHVSSAPLGVNHGPSTCKSYSMLQYTAPRTGTLNGELIAGLKETAYCGFAQKINCLKTHRTRFSLQSKQDQTGTRIADPYIHAIIH